MSFIDDDGTVFGKGWQVEVSDGNALAVGTIELIVDGTTGWRDKPAPSNTTRKWLIDLIDVPMRLVYREGQESGSRFELVEAYDTGLARGRVTVRVA